MPKADVSDAVVLPPNGLAKGDDDEPAAVWPNADGEPNADRPKADGWPKALAPVLPVPSGLGCPNADGAEKALVGAGVCPKALG